MTADNEHRHPAGMGDPKEDRSVGWLIAGAVVTAAVLFGAASKATWGADDDDPGDLTEEDQGMADAWWAGLNVYEQESLCEQISESAEARAEAADALADELTDTGTDEIMADASSDDTLDRFAKAVEAVEGYEARAVAIVGYVRDEKC